MTETPAVALALLRDAEHYLSALHGSVARHDNLGVNLTCAGCSLRAVIADTLPQLRAEAEATAPAAPLPPADQTALRDGIAEAALAVVEAALGDELVPSARAEALAGITAVLPATTNHDTDTSALLPAWEAVYEPGNVSDYLIGYANDQDPATGMAEAWLRSQAEVTGRLEWVDDKQMATGRYDRWFELIERHDDGVDTGPGIIVRRRVADETEPAAASAVTPPTNRAAVLREAIDVAREEGHCLEVEVGIEAARGARCVAYLLRKLLAKEQPPRGLADETATETQAAVDLPTLAAALREAADDLATAFGDPMVKHIGALGASHLRRRARQIEAGLRRVADETAATETQARPDVDVDTLARLLCDADVHVNNGDYPGWDDLSKTPGLGQDEVRKAARYLLKRLHIAERQPAAGARQDEAQS